MPIKSRRYRKRNNKSRRARKNKTIRKYKNANARINDLINNQELIKSLGNRANIFWEGNDGIGNMRYVYKDDMTTYTEFKKKINDYFKQIENGQKKHIH